MRTERVLAFDPCALEMHIDRHESGDASVRVEMGDIGMPLRWEELTTRETSCKMRRGGGSQWQP